MKKLLLISHVKIRTHLIYFVAEILEEVKAEYSKYRVGMGNKGRESRCGFNTTREGMGRLERKVTHAFILLL